MVFQQSYHLRLQDKMAYFCLNKRHLVSFTVIGKQY